MPSIFCLGWPEDDVNCEHGSLLRPFNLGKNKIVYSTVGLRPYNVNVTERPSLCIYFNATSIFKLNLGSEQCRLRLGIRSRKHKIK